MATIRRPAGLTAGPDRLPRRRPLLVATLALLLIAPPRAEPVAGPAVTVDHHGPRLGPAYAEVERPHPGHVRVVVDVDPREGRAGPGEPAPDDSDEHPRSHAEPEVDLEDLHLPNLVPWYPHHVYIDELDGPVSAVDRILANLRGQPEPEGRALRFSTTIENIGDHSLEILGVPGMPETHHEHLEDASTVTAYQCVRFDGPEVEGTRRYCAEHHEVGTLTYHAHHGHFHIDGFARYQLRHDVAGQPMFGSPAAIVATSEKVGFCVQDMRYARGEPAPHPWYQWCRGTPTIPYAFTQGISPGWTDTYFGGFHGQVIPLDGVPDGIYWIAVTVNPTGNPAVRIMESNRSDNTSLTRIRLFNGGTEVEVLAERGRGPHASRP